MVDRAGHLEDDPGVAPLLPPRARLARSPTVALVAAAMLSGAVVWRSEMDAGVKGGWLWVVCRSWSWLAGAGRPARDGDDEWSL